MRDFENRLTGGHPNSLGNTVEISEEVLASPELFDELFNCYFSNDEVVRLRTSNAMKRICKVNRKLLVPYVDKLLNDISRIDQASTQWTLAQLFAMLEEEMSHFQVNQAKTIMKNNLEHHEDWIVLNMTMDTLGKWAINDPDLNKWIIPHLEELKKDRRKSVSKKANKTLELLID